MNNMVLVTTRRLSKFKIVTKYDVNVAENQILSVSHCR